MSKLKWDSRFETGIEQVDNQHRRLFELTAELIEATSAGKGRRIIVDVLKSLINYTKTHFVDEEKIMEEVGFPDIAQHKIEHELFIKQVHESTKELLTGHSVPTLKVAHFLANWLIDHVLIHDKKIGKFYREKKG